ncbi:hypothetical protein HPP92_022270 [Vanilla planifolia]|uniref:Amino acid transporter transmembrane domain-containing protein n=1 Tax=Vanilla planifolia TaxID=51239 RepID=A0A835UEY4_VANPL|nr:hypothetical protein HPP92_022270 [Vanilla planifolia]
MRAVQSIDIYSSVTPPTIGFLGTPTLSKLGSRLGSSFLLSSFRGQQTPESNSSFIKPLLPSKVDSRDEQQQRRSSHSLLAPPVPAHRSSVGKPRTDYKPVRAASHELPATPRQCSFSQESSTEGGWIGLSVLLLYAILTFYTAILLRLCLDSEPGLETYPDIGQAAFGRIGRIVVSIILYLELYSCCVEYIILESDNWSSFFPNAHLDIGGLHLDSHVLFAVMATTIVLPTTWLRDLSILSYVSAGGVIATILVVGCLFWVGLIDQIGFKNEGSFVNLSGFTIAIGLYGYAYSGHAVYPNIYSSLKKQKDYTAVLFTSFCISTLLFAAAAAMGFVLFGLSTQSQFTLNMPHKFVASNVAGWTTSGGVDPTRISDSWVFNRIKDSLNNFILGGSSLCAFLWFIDVIDWFLPHHACCVNVYCDSYCRSCLLSVWHILSYLYDYKQLELRPSVFTFVLLLLSPIV